VIRVLNEEPVHDDEEDVDGEGEEEKRRRKKVEDGLD